MSIIIDCNSTVFAPGDYLSGTVSWDFEKTPANIIIELKWTTSGRGTSDSGIVFTEKHPCFSNNGNLSFEFTIPANCPPSYRGILVSLNWCVHVIADIPWALDPKATFSITISKTGEALSPNEEFIPKDSK